MSSDNDPNMTSQGTSRGHIATSLFLPPPPFSVYFTTFSRYWQQRMVRWLMNWKYLEGSGLGLIEILSRDWGKSRVSRTDFLPNTSLQYYRYTRLLGKVVSNSSRTFRHDGHTTLTKFSWVLLRKLIIAQLLKQMNPVHTPSHSISLRSV
jgi:hypothetical protein